MSDHQNLSEHELAQALRQLPDWRLEGGRLVAEFKFKDFKAAFAFMTKVAAEAERINHHPEWTNVYNRVSFKLYTHSTGGISAHDTELAQKISALVGDDSAP